MVAATVCPGSTLRVSTMPSMGERTIDFARSLSLVPTLASACRTSAWALARSALARSATAIAVSMSAWEGSLPPLASFSFFKRDRLAALSTTVAWVCATFACAAVAVARLLSVWRSSLLVSSRASACPLVTLSLVSTFTSMIVPESSLPMVISLVGSRLPVAVTVTRTSPPEIGSVM